MKKNEIRKIYGTDYKAMTVEILEKSDLGGCIREKLNGRGESGMRKTSIPVIGIKPNLVSPTPASYGGTTHPEIVAGIIEYLRAHGEYDIRIMEGSWVGDRTEESFEVCGYNDLAEGYGVALIDAQKEKSHPVDCKGLTLQICDCVDTVDFLINVPVIKGHCQTKITCALKNMKGLIPNREKRHFHAMGLHKPIAHLSAGIHQDFIVVDHICGDLDFEDGGNPVERNFILTGMDPVLMDAFVCRLLGYEVDDVPYVRMAEEIGSGSADLEHARFIMCERSGCLSAKFGADDSAKEVANVSERVISMEEMLDEALPGERKVVVLQDAVQEVESCSACYGYLLPALDMLREEGLFEKLMEKLGADAKANEEPHAESGDKPDRTDAGKICIGQGYRGKTGRIGIGQCTRGFDFTVPGCPPTEQDIYEALKEYICKE